MEIINKFQKLIAGKDINISVVGDAFLDEYYQVQATRISPEFPIPVMQRNREYPAYMLPGGAGNLCMQFLNFPVTVKLYGFFNADSAALYRDCGIEVYDTGVGITGSIPRKQRYYQGDFPLVRMDIEEPNYGLENIQEKQQRINDAIKEIKDNIILYSDYNKGVFGSNIYIPQDKTTIVDPKKGPLSKWRGCTIIKPNAKEAEELTGETGWRRQCCVIIKETECHAVIITQGGKGVVGKIGSDYFEYRPNYSISAKNPIGAGDCYMAFLAMCIGAGLDIKAAAEMAYEIGSLYVQGYKPSEFKKDKYALPLENRNYKLVMTNGCFDFGLTKAHIEVLKFAKSQGDKLLVAINSDRSVKALKGEFRPIMSLEDRMHIISALECVDFVVGFDDPTPIKLIENIKPDILVKGGDYKPEEVAGHGLVEVIIAPKFESISTTEKIRKEELARNICDKK